MEQVFVGPHSRTKIYAARMVRGISRSIDMCCRPALLWAHDGTKQQFSKPTGPRLLLSIDGTDGQTTDAQPFYDVSCRARNKYWHREKHVNCNSNNLIPKFCTKRQSGYIQHATERTQA